MENRKLRDPNTKDTKDMEPAKMTSRSQAQATAMKLVLACGATFVACAGSIWGMISVHAAQPHEGAVTRNEIRLIRDLMESQHATIRMEIEAVRGILEREAKK